MKDDSILAIDCGSDDMRQKSETSLQELILYTIDNFLISKKAFHELHMMFPYIIPSWHELDKTRQLISATIPVYMSPDVSKIVTPNYFFS